MNELALSKIGWIIRTMSAEAGKLNPPVNRISKVTKNDPFRSLVFTILSARTKDENTMASAGALLKIAPDPDTLARTPVRRIEALVRPSGFYHNKAKSLSMMARMLVSDFGGVVPSSMESLLLLPGVGRKTANVLLVYSFGKDAIPVDTHVHRISNRLGIVKTKTPERTEAALQSAVPRRYRKSLNHAFVSYGQTICLPMNPKCAECRLNRVCWRIGVKK
jgi:endonuclease-3